MLSPTAWRASHEGLKALTLVPNPIRKSPQTQVTCGWKMVLMHKHYNMSMHQFLCFVSVFDCLLIYYVGGCLFIYLCILLFIFVFDQYFYSYVSKNSKTTSKNWKSKCLIDIVEFCLKTCFALYLCVNGFVHFRA